MTNFLDKLDAYTSPIEWSTISSLPSGGIKYQEATLPGIGLVARVTKSGYETTSPSDDTRAVYRRFQSDVARYLCEDAEPSQ